MGDVLRTTALLPGLKRKYPDSSIFWAVDAESVDLLRNNPLVDRIIPFTPITSSNWPSPGSMSSSAWTRTAGPRRSRRKLDPRHRNSASA